MRETGTNFPIANIREDPHVAAYVGLDRKPDRSAARAANPEADLGTDLRRGASPGRNAIPCWPGLGSGRSKANTRHAATLAAEAEDQAEQKRVQEPSRQGHEGSTQVEKTAASTLPRRSVWYGC